MTERSDNEEDLVEQAYAFRETYGDRWADEAVANLREVSQNGEPALFERWVRLIDIMTKLGQPRH